MENENQQRLSSWDEYVSGNFLKAVNVGSENEEFICTNVAEAEREGVKHLRLTLERDGNEWEFDVNKTNARKLQESVDSPQKLVGKKLSFKKALVRNPKTNNEVESLRVSKVVDAEQN